MRKFEMIVISILAIILIGIGVSANYKVQHAPKEVFLEQLSETVEVLGVNTITIE